MNGNYPAEKDSLANLHEAVATAERVEKVRNSDPVPLRRV